MGLWKSNRNSLDGRAVCVGGCSNDFFSLAIAMGRSFSSFLVGKSTGYFFSLPAEKRG